MNSEKGFSLVELLLAIAITGVIFSIVGTLIYQLTEASEFNSAKMTANHELQNASNWFIRDGQTAMSATGSTSLTFALPSSQTITYSLTGKSLIRSTGALTTVLAQNISGAGFTVQGRLVSMNITSIPSGRTGVSEQNVYQVYLRSSAQ